MSEKKALFDPTRFGFILLRTYQPAGTHGFPVELYEYGGHPCVDGAYSWLRRGCYLSLALPSWVFVWEGHLDPIGVAVMFKANGETMASGYADEERLFRGHITSDEQAGHIFKALGLRGPFGVLKPGSDGNLEDMDIDGGGEEWMRESVMSAFGSRKRGMGVEELWAHALDSHRKFGHAGALDRGFFERELARLSSRASLERTMADDGQPDH